MNQVDGPAGRSESRRRIFVSYAREDQERMQSLVEGLEMLGMDVWLDESVLGGESWWDAILGRIRESDVFLQVVSPAALESEACQRERRYAGTLGKAVLPVMVGAIRPDTLPRDLAPLQLVDYADATPRRAFQLAAALAACPASPPLPDVLPPEPEVPISYLGGLADKVRSAASLSLDEQLALVARLRAAVDQPPDRDTAIELLRRLQRRGDLYHAVALEIDQALAAAARTAPAASESEAVSARVVDRGKRSWAVELLRGHQKTLLIVETRHSTDHSLRIGSTELDKRQTDHSFGLFRQSVSYDFSLPLDGDRLRAHVVIFYKADLMTLTGVRLEIEGRVVLRDGRAN